MQLLTLRSVYWACFLGTAVPEIIHSPYEMNIMLTVALLTIGVAARGYLKDVKNVGVSGSSKWAKYIAEYGIHAMNLYIIYSSVSYYGGDSFIYCTLYIIIEAFGMSLRKEE